MLRSKFESLVTYLCLGTVGFTIVSMTVSLVAVFIPVLFMGGILGRLFREFAVTISTAILVSGFVSLSLTPMLASRLLKSHGLKESALHESTNGNNRKRRGISERIYDRFVRGYEWTLQLVLAHSFLTIVVACLVLGLTIYLFGVVPKGFIPR